ncbi:MULTISPECIES: flavin reductase [Pseudomonas]|uniref:flavin reductase n=1 Tax=Pseudomonas TaxID=286 RepID=UPI001E56CEEA|nr:MULTISPECIES: flavin reductase [Pseudomonas]MCE1116789.1 flavin reductase [Pseudomonas sp. NMI795_08]
MDAINFREAMTHLGAAVNVITTDGKAGLGGFTASAVCSVTDSPPTLLFCMNKGGFQYERFVENGVACVNVLHGRQEDISQTFSGALKLSVEDRFKAVAWSTLQTSSPALDDSLVSFDCRIVRVNEVGTHGVFICEVQAVRFGAHNDSLMYFRRQYHRLAQAC